MMESRRWTKAERDMVVLLWHSTKHGPKKLSEKTGIPVAQIKFWLASAAWVPKRKKGTPDDTSYRTDFQDWESWRGSTLRGGFLKLGRLYPWAANPPTRPEITDWLRSLTMVCYYCDIPLVPKNFSVDHKQPVMRGGTSAFDNLCPACKRCNDVKEAMTEAEFDALMVLVAGWEDGGKRLFRRLRGGFIPGRRAAPATVPAV